MPQQPLRIPWLDYLRSFITLLVVAHHSALAYTTFASFDKQAYIRSTHPIVDIARARSLDLFEDFNDVFFMSLMFLISSIFVLPAIGRKGVGLFGRAALVPLGALLFQRSPCPLLSRHPATASSLAFLALFARLFRRRYKIWDSLAGNAYGIYLVHYIFVVWIQFLLLRVTLPAQAKFGITFLLSFLLSWFVTAQARKGSVVARYL